MSDIVSPLLQWLNDHPQLAGLATFIISAAESVAIIGTIVPGSIMMTALGTLAGAGVIPLWQTIFWAILGAIAGDGISYWIGHYFKDRLPKVWPFRSNPSLLRAGEIFFHKYGAMSVFIGRFVGPVRALVPLVAGMLGMKPLQFTVANVLSAIGWAPAYMLPGILLGAASLELPPDIAIHVILVLLLLGLFILLCLWFLYKIFQLVSTQISQMQTSIWLYLKKKPHLAPVTRLLKHHDEQKTYGQLNLAFYFFLTVLLFLGLVLFVKCVGPDNIMVNQAMFHLFRGVRNETADTVMIYLTLLGQKQVILPVVIVLFAWLVLWKRWRVAFHALALGVLAAGSIFVIKHILKSPRPWGIQHAIDSYSLPSGHATLSTVVYVGIAFLICTKIKPKFRFLVYSPVIALIILIGISRLYLGAHWFTDVLGAWLLSTALLIAVIISYQREPEKPINGLGIFLVSLITLMLTFGFYQHKHFTQLVRDYRQIPWPTATLAMSEWWLKNEGLFAYRTSLFGFPSQRINVEWSGDLEKIRAALLKEGWVKPPPRDFISTLHRITDVKSAQYLPLVSPQYLDKKPALTMTRQMNNEKSLLVIRLWNSNRILKENNATLWVGVINIVPRSYSWIYKSSPGVVDIQPSLIFPNKSGTGEWQWKMITMNQALPSKKQASQDIMLVRSNISVHKKK